MNLTRISQILNSQAFALLLMIGGLLMLVGTAIAPTPHQLDHQSEMQQEK